ncbi:ABC transporter permease [Dictyobacter formicarum]|uniref:ABC transporter permease n=1 Tax=Dictyobacter formicarum TaxID=2778368 RepID=A0ABQ3VGZ5_9CHLR|nr:ABC-2 family transporter protein [Dictyobacter formicarum]GHO84951.1 ABC transporter permease [Dictyobacter formicarum]
MERIMTWLKLLTSEIRLILAYVVANTQSALEYRSAFIVQVISMAANDSLWLFFWWNYFQQFPLVNGWKSTDIVILWAVSACGFGVSVAIFGNARQIPTLIMNGGLDAYLGMPRYALLHVCIAATDPAAWGDIIFAVGAYLLLVHPDPGHIALFIILVPLAALIYTSFQVLLGSLAFFLGNTEGMSQQLFGALISFSTYPMDIFNNVVRVLLFTVLPAGFISFVPLQLLRHFSWPLLGILLGAVSAFTLGAIALFSAGLRRYESGNLMGAQI